MLRKVNEGKVESDEGYSIHIVGLELLEYQENSKKIQLDWTFNSQTKKITIYASDAKAWMFPSKEEMTKSDRERVINNIKKAVRLLTGDFEVV